MNLKDFKLFDKVETIGIYLHVSDNVFVVMCDRLSFNIFSDIELEVEDSTIFSEQELCIFMSYKRSLSNDVLATKLINRAFDNKLPVFDSYFNLISKLDFTSISLGKGYGLKKNILKKEREIWN